LIPAWSGVFLRVSGYVLWLKAFPSGAGTPNGPRTQWVQLEVELHSGPRIRSFSFVGVWVAVIKLLFIIVTWTTRWRFWAGPCLLDILPSGAKFLWRLPQGIRPRRLFMRQQLKGWATCPSSILVPLFFQCTVLMARMHANKHKRKRKNVRVKDSLRSFAPCSPDFSVHFINVVKNLTNAQPVRNAHSLRFINATKRSN